MNIAAFVTGMVKLQTDMETRTEDAKGEYAQRLAGLIKDLMTSATVTVAAGIPVATAGSATSQTGATTATGTATIS